MKLIAVVILFAFSSSQAFSSDADEKQFARGCGTQVMNAVVSAHQDKTGVLKKIVFNKKDDQAFLDNFQSLQTLQNQFVKSGSSDKAIATKMVAALDSSTELSKKMAPKEFALCLDFNHSLAAQVTKTCPDLKENDPAFQEKINHCAEAASKLPMVAGAMEASNKALYALIKAKK